MKVRLLKEKLNNPKYIIQGDNKCIKIGSVYCSDLLQYNRSTGTIKIGLDTFNEGRKSIKNEKLVEIYEALLKLVESNEIESFFDGNDEVENQISIYTYDYKSNSIVEKFTDGPCEWPNNTLDGEVIYNNTHFINRADCVKDTIRGHLLRIDSINERVVGILDDIQRDIQRVEDCNSLINSECKDNKSMKKYTHKQRAKIYNDNSWRRRK